MIRSINGLSPKIAEGCFIAENATVAGDVEIGEGSSVWFGAVIRGDEAKIVIGKNTNIQDNAVLHCNAGCDMTIGDYVTVGHGAIVHGATVGDKVLIGMGSTVMDHALVEDNSIIGAGALVPSNTVISAGSVAVGIPARVIKNAGDENSQDHILNAMAYRQLAEDYNK